MCSLPVIPLHVYSFLGVCFSGEIDLGKLLTALPLSVLGDRLAEEASAYGRCPKEFRPVGGKFKTISMSFSLFLMAVNVPFLLSEEFHIVLEF